MRAELDAARSSLLPLVDAAAASKASAEAVALLVDGTLAAFELGETPLIDVLDVLRAATDAELRAVELRAAALAASRRVDYLSALVPITSHEP
jgi:outer membrane protein TolC